MFGVSLEADQASIKRLRRLERETPRTLRRAFGMAASAASRQLVATAKAGGGKNGVPTFRAKSWETRAIERANGGKATWFGQFGSRTFIRHWMNGNVQKVGFIDAVGEFAGRMQDGERRALRGSDYAAFRAAGIRTEQMPEMYERPERNIIDTYSAYLFGGVYADWVVRNVEKLKSGLIK